MQRLQQILLSASALLLISLPAQAAEPQPAAAAAPSPAPAIVQPAAPQAAPGLSLLAPKAPVGPQLALAAKIGVVDINKVSVESAMGKAAQAQIKGQQTKLQKQIEARRKQLDKFKAEVERQLPGMSPQQREAKSKEFQKKVAEFQKFGQHAEQELMATQQKLTKELLETIGQLAADLGRGKGLAAVVVNRELLYSAQGAELVDLTPELVKQLDEKVKKK